MTTTASKTWTATGLGENGLPETITATIAENPEWAEDSEGEYRYHVAWHSTQDGDFDGDESDEDIEDVAASVAERLADIEGEFAGRRESWADALRGAVEDLSGRSEVARAVNLLARLVEQGKAGAALAALRDVK